MDGSADLYTRLLPGYDLLYLRLYAKFEDECRNIHHWVWLGGHNPSTSWPWPSRTFETKPCQASLNVSSLRLLK